MVVPTQNDGGAMGSGAAKVGMLKNITAAVNTWSLAVPDAIHAIDPGPGEQVRQAGSPSPPWRRVLH